MRDTREVTNSIPFIEYRLPNGSRYPFDFTLATPESLAKAKLIKNAGFWFEIERLRNGMISATITDANNDWAIAIGDDAPGLEHIINQMIMDFDIEATVQLSANEEA